MLAQQLVNGVMLGAVYALIAIGYTLILGVLGLLHLAHGEVFMALGAAMLATGLLGLLLERAAFRPLRRAHPLAPLATTIGAGIALQETARWYFGAERQGFPSTIARELWRARRHQLAAILSGGEQQMLAIAPARVGRPALLMLDEPSLGLAPLVVDEVFAIVREPKREGTIILLEQNARQARQVADRAYILETGMIVVEGSAAELAAGETVQRAYLGK